MSNAVDIPKQIQPSQCRSCATLSCEEQWKALPLFTTIAVEAIVPRIATRWRGGPVEVRTCSGCGRHISRRASAVRQPTERGVVR
jgi:hypothetical protein